MDRNTEMFENSLPSISYNRSTFRYNVPIKTTFNTGDLVPFYQNILVQPGDTFKMDMSYVIRLTTPYFPTMDNLYLDVYFFAYDWLNAWDGTKEFWGENLTAPWAVTTERLIPIIKSGTNGFTSKSIMDHLGGCRLYTGNIYSQRLGLNTYLSAYNEYFRDQNLIAPITIDKSDADMTFDPTNSAKGGPLLKVAKFHSYFNSALLQPQKGTTPTLPIGTSAPVIGPSTLKFTTDINSNTKDLYINSTTRNNDGTTGANTSDERVVLISSTGSSMSPITGAHPLTYASGLEVDLANAIGATLNAQRYVIGVQHILEKQALFGSRYRERIYASWGVRSNDMAQHVPEYLGGFRAPINMETVVQTSSTDSTSPQGNTSAFSVTAGSEGIFTKSFTEHACILAVMCVRQDYVYTQGVSCMNSKRRVYDLYNNELAHIGCQPIYEDELLATPGSQTATNRAIFGYKPPFQEYRREEGWVSGELNPEYRNANGQNLPLDKWTYLPKFNSAPVLSQQFIEETPENVDRTIVLPSSTADQFIMDINLSVTKVSEVPQWGVPGIDKF